MTEERDPEDVPVVRDDPVEEPVDDDGSTQEEDA